MATTNTAGQTAITAKMARTGKAVESSHPAIQGPAMEPILAIEIAQPAPLPR